MAIMKASYWRAVLAAAAFALSSAASATPDADKVDGWQIVCQAATPASCQMFTAPDGAEGAPVFLLTVNAAADRSGEFAVVTVPQRVYLVPGIEIRVDKHRPFKALFELCDETGCHAGFRLAGPVLDAFRRGQTAKVRIWTARDKAIEFAVSLNGFSKAFERLKSGGRP